MAIDTAQKRASAATVCSRWHPPSVPPDGSIGTADRAHSGWSYAGIAASSPPAPVIGPDTLDICSWQEDTDLLYWGTKTDTCSWTEEDDVAK